MSKKTPRGLTPEEKHLWDRVARSANPLNAAPPNQQPLPEIFDPKPAEPRAIAPFRIGERTMATALPPVKSARLPTPQMDKKAFTQLKRGKINPQARVDLHGMTLAQAGPVLTRFIFQAYAQGFRLVLVITGKGKDRDPGGPIPTPKGILRRQVPQWLASTPLASMVLDVVEAHLKHGGSGAYYVYLRRRK